MQTNTATATVERPVILPQADAAAKAPTARKRATRAGAARPFGTQTSEAVSFGALLVTLVVTKASFFTSALSYV
jgi:hypothetical protein